jgi:hypothetical protein
MGRASMRDGTGNMKKGLIGCLLVGVLLIAAGAGLAYFYIVRPIVGAGTAVVEGARDWARSADAEAAIRNQSPFTAPEDGRLTPDQVNRFVAILSNVQLRMGADFETLRTEYERMQAEQAAAGRNPDVGDVIGAYKGLGDLVARAREAQVEGLNRQNMSLAEYRWIRDQAYSALPFLDMNPDAIVAPKPPEGAAVDAATGEVIEIPDEPVEAAPAEGEPATAPVDDGLEYAGTAPEVPGIVLGPSGSVSGRIVDAPMPQPVKEPEVKDRGLGDDRALDDPATQAARANAVLLRPHKDLLLRSLGGSWLGL